jgi:hypothetical protein
MFCHPILDNVAQLFVRPVSVFVHVTRREKSRMSQISRPQPSKRLREKHALTLLVFENDEVQSSSNSRNEAFQYDVRFRRSSIVRHGRRVWRCDANQLVVRVQVRRVSFTREQIDLLQHRVGEQMFAKQRDDALLSQSGDETTDAKALPDGFVVVVEHGNGADSRGGERARSQEGRRRARGC